MEYFALTNHKLSDNSTKAMVTSSSYFQNAFGNVLIRSMSKECHCWQFQILKNKESYGMDIGIVQDNDLDLQESFTSKGLGFGLCSNGNIYSSNAKNNKQNYKLKNCKQKYKTNDIVLMTLDLSNKTLSFVIDNQKQKTINEKIIIPNITTNKKINYKMAVYLSQKKDCVKLLNHIKSIGMDEKQEMEQEQLQSKIIKYEEMISKLQNEFMLQKEENEQYKNDIHSLQHELININKSNNLYLDKICKTNEQNIKKFKNEIKNLQNEKNKYKKEIESLQNDLENITQLNLDSIFRKNEDHNENITRINQYKSDIKKLQSQLQNIKNENQFHVDKIIKQNGQIVFKLRNENDKYKKTIDSLQNELKRKDLVEKELKQSKNITQELQIELNEIKVNHTTKQHDQLQQIDSCKADNFRLMQHNEEYKQSNDRLQSRILTLKKENQSLRNNRDQTQRINLNQRKQIETLQSENKKLKSYVNSL